MPKNKARQERIDRLYPAPEGSGDPLVNEAAASYGLGQPPLPDVVKGDAIEREITDEIRSDDLM